MKKRSVLFAAVAAVIVLLSVGCSKDSDKKTGDAESPYKGQTLTLSMWGYNMDLLEKNYIRPFEEKYGVTIVSETGNNADRLTKLVARKDKPIVDVAYFAGNFAYDAMKQDLLQPYDPAKIPNLKEIIPSAVDPLGGRYAVGYSLSHMGLFYRSDKTAPITSWKDLSRAELKGFLSIPGITTTYGPGLIYMLSKAWGGDVNNTEVGWAKVAELAPSLVTAYNTSSELNSLIIQEEVYAAPYTSFSWGQIEASGLPVASAIPEEGLVGSFSVVSIVKGSPNVELAHLFIDHLLSYDVQYSEAMDLVDSPVRTDVKLPADIAAKLTYGDELISNLFFYNEEDVAKNKADWVARWNRIFSK
ncbi:ABC transporter substrate-binding protein [Breznakiella homolactica]|uniref:ABC transporter substrate-binding protein n=1 Tax=Breznakiella homolactica TaxID=2798577 RepID=A0A7T8BBG2_9SPIR|nr:ABC transporter substrate-binding protein [Breznakiella homolactica]QQO09198.1 ABC transporter substrate-binding protein [Breznakiella homolactica]